MDAELIANYIATVCLPLSVLMGLGMLLLIFKLRSQTKLIKKMEYDNVLHGYSKLLDQYRTFIDRVNGNNKND